jgi:hypothetical protein
MAVAGRTGVRGSLATTIDAWRYIDRDALVVAVGVADVDPPQSVWRPYPAPAAIIGGVGERRADERKAMEAVMEAVPMAMEVVPISECESRRPGPRMKRCTRETAAAELRASTGAAKTRASAHAAEMASCHATGSHATCCAATHAAAAHAASTYRAATHAAGLHATSTCRAAAHAAGGPAASTSHAAATAAATLCERRCRKGKRRAKRTRDDTFKELVAHDQSS